MFHLQKNVSFLLERRENNRAVPPFRPGENTRVSVLEFVLELSLEEFFLIMKKSLESV